MLPLWLSAVGLPPTFLLLGSSLSLSAAAVRYLWTLLLLVGERPQTGFTEFYVPLGLRPVDFTDERWLGSHLLGACSWALPSSLSLSSARREPRRPACLLDGGWTWDAAPRSLLKLACATWNALEYLMLPPSGMAARNTLRLWGWYANRALRSVFLEVYSRSAVYCPVAWLTCLQVYPQLAASKICWPLVAIPNDLLGGAGWYPSRAVALQSSFQAGRIPMNWIHHPAVGNFSSIWTLVARLRLSLVWRPIYAMQTKLDKNILQQ